MMTHKILTSTVLALLFSLSVAPALARESNLTPRPTNSRGKEVREVRTTPKATIQQSKLESNKKKITGVYSGLTTAFTSRFNALKSYLDRVQAKLTTKKATLPTNQKLIDAQTKIDNVNTNLITKYNTDFAAFNSKLTEVSTSADPKTLVPELKTLAKTVEQDLKNIRSELVVALRLVVQAK